jgi:hypothetical protein
MIKTPIDYNRDDALARDAYGAALFSVAGWRYNWLQQNPRSPLTPEDGHQLAEYIATCINLHETLTAQVAELKGEVERLKKELRREYAKTDPRLKGEPNE